MNESLSEGMDQPPDLKVSRRRRLGFREYPQVGDRLPPHSTEAEQGVLGCILLSPNETIGTCVEQLQAGPATFYDLRHQVIYETLLEMYGEREAVDIITLQQRLKDKSRLDEVGGVAYLATLPDTVPSAANITFYTDILKEKHALRSVIQVCTETVTRVYEGDGSMDELMDGFERDALAIRKSGGGGEVSLNKLLNECISEMEEAAKNPGKLRGLETGFSGLDKITNGLRGGQMIVVAARPSVGKTSLVMNIAEYLAVDLKTSVGVFSLEMTAKELVFRMACSRARVDSSIASSGLVTSAHTAKLAVAVGQINKAPLHINDQGGLTIGQIQAKARRMAQQHKIKVLVLDYVQLVKSGGRDENRNALMTIVSNGVKAMAKELDVPVIVCSQLNRETEKESRKPRLSDLRDSGAIEQDADLVALLHRVPVPDDAAESDAQEVELLVPKNRSGRTGFVHLTFLRNYTRFVMNSKIPAEVMK